MPQEILRLRVDRLERQVSELVGLRDVVMTLQAQVLRLRDEMHVAFSAIDATIRAGDEETRRMLRDEIRAGDEESRRFMRVLYEDLVERIKRIREG